MLFRSEEAGLKVDNGIVVDGFGRTSDPNIRAVGDVTNHHNPLLDRSLRLESGQHAQNHAIAVAKAICGHDAPYAEIPWFWSDQYDVNFQILGVPERWASAVLRGDLAARKFTLVYLDDENRIVGMNAANGAQDIAVGRRLMARNAPLDPAVLADESLPLKRLLKASG